MGEFDSAGSVVGRRLWGNGCGLWVKVVRRLGVGDGGSGMLVDIDGEGGEQELGGVVSGEGLAEGVCD